MELGTDERSVATTGVGATRFWGAVSLVTGISLDLIRCTRRVPLSHSDGNHTGLPACCCGRCSRGGHGAACRARGREIIMISLAFWCHCAGLEGRDPSSGGQRGFRREHGAMCLHGVGFDRLRVEGGGACRTMRDDSNWIFSGLPCSTSSPNAAGRPLETRPSVQRRRAR
nr:hypothetical protein CFP56_12185 [Quercus suber]